MDLVLSIFQTRYVAHLLLALIDGPQSFGTLLEKTRMASSGTLSARLRDLQRWQLVKREHRMYALLPAGRASFSVLRQMELWGRQRPADRASADHILLQRAGSLAIIHALTLEPQRVRDLCEQVRRVSRRSLLHRLQELTEAGFVQRQGEPTSVHYSLTELGQTLRPVIEELTVWWSMYRALKLVPPQDFSSDRPGRR